MDLAATSPGFQALHARIGELLQARWPETRLEHVFPDTSYDMQAWVVPVPDHPPKETWKGTMPNDVFVVGPTQKKAGITIHVWHPNHPYLLKDNADWLKEAGFKPMVGCLQWNRKADVPIEALAKLFDELV